jgi:hypothetical protein
MASPICVGLLYILHFTSLNGIYFSWKCLSVEPKTEAVPPSQDPSVHPSTIAFIGLGLVHILDQAPVVVCV